MEVSTPNGLRFLQQEFDRHVAIIEDWVSVHQFSDAASVIHKCVETAKYRDHCFGQIAELMSLPCYKWGSALDSLANNAGDIDEEMEVTHQLEFAQALRQKGAFAMLELQN